MNKPVIAITGASGFIGGALVSQLSSKGFRVIALARTTLNLPGLETRRYDLAEKPLPGTLAGIDLLIHCAFDAADKKIQDGVNFSSSKQLFQIAEEAGVKKIIFFSSIAAQPSIQSVYGKNKLAIESLLDEKKQVIIRPGLVIGTGGLFGRLLKTIVAGGKIPLINGGKQPMQFIALSDLLTSVESIISRDLKGIFTLANQSSLTYRGFFESVAKFYQKKPGFLPVNSGLLIIALKMAAFIGVKLPVSEQNLKGLLSQRAVDPAQSLSILQLNPLSLDESLAQLSKTHE